MIQNKKLLIITLIVGALLCLGIDVPLLVLRKIPPYSVLNGIFFIGNAILGIAIYSLIYVSLKKTALVKKIYQFALFMGGCVFVLGIIVIVYAMV